MWCTFSIRNHLSIALQGCKLLINILIVLISSLSKPPIYELSNYDVVADVELVFYGLHVVVVLVERHIIVLKPVESMCNMRPAGIDEGVWILIMDVVVDVVLFFQQIAEVRSGLVE